LSGNVCHEVHHSSSSGGTIGVVRAALLLMGGFAVACARDHSAVTVSNRPAPTSPLAGLEGAWAIAAVTPVTEDVEAINARSTPKIVVGGYRTTKLEPSYRAELRGSEVEFVPIAGGAEDGFVLQFHNGGLRVTQHVHPRHFNGSRPLPAECLFDVVTVHGLRLHAQRKQEGSLEVYLAAGNVGVAFNTDGSIKTCTKNHTNSYRQVITLHRVRG
jgi:hypothetical protein